MIFLEISDNDAMLRSTPFHLHQYLMLRINNKITSPLSHPANGFISSLSLSFWSLPTRNAFTFPGKTIIVFINNDKVRRYLFICNQGINTYAPVRAILSFLIYTNAMDNIHLSVLCARRSLLAPVCWRNLPHRTVHDIRIKRFANRLCAVHRVRLCMRGREGVLLWGRIRANLLRRSND